MRVGIVGCGLIGNKRARALGAERLVAVADANAQRAEQLARQHAGCQVSPDWQALVARGDVDTVVVATTNDVLAPVTAEAVVAVLCGEGLPEWAAAADPRRFAGVHA